MARSPMVCVGGGSRALGLLVASAVLATAVTALAPARATLAAQADGEVVLGFVNGLPEQPLVSVSVDGTVVAAELPYGQATEAIRVPSGSRRVTVSAAGGSATLVESELDLLAGAAYVVAAFEDEGDPALGRWRFDRSPAEDGESRVQLVHLSPDTPDVDVAVEGGDVLLANVGFTEASASREVPAGTYDLEMRPAGSNKVVQEVPDVTVEEETGYCIMGLGLFEDDGSLDLVTFTLPLNDASLPASGVGAVVASSPDSGRLAWTLGVAAIAAAIAAVIAALRLGR